MKILLIGLGRWGERHLRVLTELGVELWVSDLSEERCQFAVKSGVDPARVVREFRNALPYVDAVDLVTPAVHHLELAGECLRAGKDCFVEKPLAPTVAEGRALADQVRATGRILQVGHIFRLHPVTAVLGERLASGTLGPVRYCTGRFAGFKRPRMDVGVTQTDAIHYFDLFAYLLGREPTAVNATLRDHLGRGLDDLSFVVVEYGDVLAVVESGYFAPGTYRDCTIVCERGTLTADFGSSVVQIHGNRHIKAMRGWQAEEGPVETVRADGAEPLRQELELFLEAVATRGKPLVDVEAGLLALQTVDAAYISSRLGRRVTLEELGGHWVSTQGDRLGNPA